MTAAFAWLDQLVRATPTPSVAGSLEAYWAAHRARLAGIKEAVDGAISGGFAADRLGYAFAAGYHAALRALVPSLEPGRVVGLSATEEGGAHPRAIHSRLAPAEHGGFLLSGDKRWSTLAAVAEELLVIASTGTSEAGRNQLRLVRVRTDAPGVKIVPMPATPFAPEIPHCAISFDAVLVAADAVLPGDGYTDYLKPFRTLEDLHVHAALLGYFVAVARRSGFPRQLVERALAILVSTRALSLGPPAEPGLHIALAGVLDATARLLDDAAEHFERADPGERARWERDQPLLSVASKARGARLERAWQAVRKTETGESSPR